MSVSDGNTGISTHDLTEGDSGYVKSSTAVISEPSPSRCDPNPCQNGGTCRKDGPEICNCPDFVGGEYCDESPCNTNPCKNGEICTAIARDEIECSCPDGYSGNNCENQKSKTTSIQRSTKPEDESTYSTPPGEDSVSGMSVSDGNTGISTHDLTEGDSAYVKSSTAVISEPSPSRCDPNPCQNGGTCRKSGPEICNCIDFVSGEYCDESPCNSNPCENGEKCTAIGRDEIECSCPDGYSGNNCENQIGDVILSSSTQSNPTELKTSSVRRSTKPYLPEDGTTYSSASDEDGVTRMSESDGKTSRKLSAVTSEPSKIGDETLSSSTQSHPTEAETSSIRRSTEPFLPEDKTTSSAAPSRCDSNPCQNGGTCKTSGPQICLCPVYTEGEFCDESPCNSNPCKNGEICTATDRDEIECSCPDGYFGDNCENQESTISSTSTEVNSKEITTNKETGRKTKISDKTNSADVYTTPLSSSVPTNADQYTNVTSDIPTDTRRITDSPIYSSSSSSSTVSTTENMINTESDETPTTKIPTSTKFVTSDKSKNETRATDPTSFSTSEYHTETINQTLPSASSSAIRTTENMTDAKSKGTPTTEMPSGSSLITSSISKDGTSTTHSTVSSTSVNDKETTIQTSPSESSSTVSTTKNMTNTMSKETTEILTSTSYVTSGVPEDSTPATDPTILSTTEKNIETTITISPSDSSSTISTTKHITDTKSDETPTSTSQVTSGISSDDAANEHISGNPRAYITGWAVGGSALVVLCLVSAGIYALRRYRRSKFRSTTDYDTNSIMTECSNSSQNNLV